MSEWKTYRLGDICKFYYGKALPAIQRIPGEIPVYSSAGITGWHNKALSNGPAIIIGRKGTVGSVFYTSVPFFCIDTTYYILSDDTLYDIKFLYYLLKSLKLELLNEDSVVPGLNRETAYNQHVLLPPLDEQRKIAGILGALDDKIELNRRINANLEEQAQALFKSWFIDDESLKSKSGFFKDIIQTTLSGDWGKEVPKGNYLSEVYCIRGADIPNIKYGDKGNLPTRFILEKNLQNKKLSENDLVVEISGGSPTQSTGRICLITNSLLHRLGKNVICTNFCRALKPVSGYSFFIYLYWQYLYNKNIMFSYENGTTGIKNLDITDFLNKEAILIPDKNRIQEFNNMLQPIYDMIYRNGMENEQLSALRDTLLPKLMKGEIKIN